MTGNQHDNKSHYSRCNMKTTFTIFGSLPTLNNYTHTNRANRYRGAQMKRDETTRVFWEIKKQCIPKCTTPPFITFRWICKDDRSDKDNICFAKKFILDGMVLAKIIPNDGWNDIRGFTDEFAIDKDNPRVEVVIS